jgi:hypothetical protein
MEGTSSIDKNSDNTSEFLHFKPSSTYMLFPDVTEKSTSVKTYEVGKATYNYPLEKLNANYREYKNKSKSQFLTVGVSYAISSKTSDNIEESEVDILEEQFINEPFLLKSTEINSEFYCNNSSSIQFKGPFEVKITSPDRISSCHWAPPSSVPKREESCTTLKNTNFQNQKNLSFLKSRAVTNSEIVIAKMMEESKRFESYLVSSKSSLIKTNKKSQKKNSLDISNFLSDQNNYKAEKKGDICSRNGYSEHLSSSDITLIEIKENTDDYYMSYNYIPNAKLNGERYAYESCVKCSPHIQCRFSSKDDFATAKHLSVNRNLRSYINEGVLVPSTKRLARSTPNSYISKKESYNDYIIKPSSFPQICELTLEVGASGLPSLPQNHLLKGEEKLLSDNPNHSFRVSGSHNYPSYYYYPQSEYLPPRSS